MRIKSYENKVIILQLFSKYNFILALFQLYFLILVRVYYCNIITVMLFDFLSLASLLHHSIETKSEKSKGCDYCFGPVFSALL